MATKKLLLAIIIISGLSVPTMAQTQEIHSVVPITGTTISGSNGTVSYSIGQMVYTTNSGTTGSVSQGIQQPYEIQIVSGIEEAKSVGLTCSVYPNPVSDLLTIKLGNYTKGDLSYQLFEINGSLVIHNQITTDETSFSMKNIKPSVYFLKVMTDGQVIKTFKITKN